MPAVEVPSTNSASVSLVPRPHRRWISMNTTVPIGRAMNASEKTANESSVPSRRDSNGKNMNGKHQHRRDAVDEVVEVLGRPADDHADGDVAGRDLRRIGRDRARIAFEGVDESAGLVRRIHVCSTECTASSPRSSGYVAHLLRRRRHHVGLEVVHHPQDPLSVMTTSTRVKISDIHVQPPSAFEVMCRKNTMCT